MLGPPVAAVFGAYGAVKLGPPIVRRARQRAYDEACAAEAVRLVIAPTAAIAVDPGAATALIRALHPHLGPGRDEPLLETLATDRRRPRSSAPVSSAAWVELLGYGGAEDTSALA